MVFDGQGEPNRTIDIPLQDGDDFAENPMRIRATMPDARGVEHGCPAPVFANVETYWWDGSQIYG